MTMFILYSLGLVGLGALLHATCGPFERRPRVPRLPVARLISRAEAKRMEVPACRRRLINQ